MRKFNFLSDGIILGYHRGKCVLPNKCACLCKGRRDKKYCKKFGGSYCKKPFQDSLYKHRVLLEPDEVFGTRDCWSGFEGAVDEYDDFISCHMVIYEADYVTRNTVDIIVGFSIGIVLFALLCWYIKRRLRNREDQKRAKLRKEKRDTTLNAFIHHEDEIIAKHDSMDKNERIRSTLRRPRSRSRARYTIRKR